MATLSRWVTAALIWAMFVAAARADQPPLSQSYTKMTSDGRYLLVMLDPSRVEEDIRWNPATVAEVKTIHRTYTRSGLYRKGDTSDPLWTVNWYAHGVEAAADGVHMIRVNAWIGSPDDRSPGTSVEPGDH